MGELLFYAKKIGPNCAGLYSGAGSGSYRLGIGACDMHGLADCNNTAEPFLYSCYMRPCVVCIKLRMERLHFYQIQKICTCSVPTSVLEYPEISTKMCCLQRGSYEREKSNEETRAVDKEKKTLYISLWGLLI